MKKSRFTDSQILEVTLPSFDESRSWGELCGFASLSCEPVLFERHGADVIER
jgi:hypothetical protein